MKIIHYDITEIKGYIVQQVNCQNKMGKGLAKALYNKYPKVKKDYHKFCNNYNSPEELLGKVLFVNIDNDTTICNMFSQLKYGNTKGNTKNRYTDYKVFYNCLEYICKNSPDKIYVPYMIGCGLGGGDWNVIQKILLYLENKYNKEIIIVRKDN